ncbi:MAG: hypothetical protein ACRD2F_08435 [Terriglobales bacterium]
MSGIAATMLAPLWASLLSLWLILWGLNLISRPWLNVLLYGGLAALLIATILSIEEGEAPAPTEPPPPIRPDIKTSLRQ